MPLQRSNTADKFIVDRRKPHRNSDVSRAVRRTRDRLSQQAGNPAFDRELLKLHAQAIIKSVASIPLLVITIAAAGLLAGMSVDILTWALVTVTCYAGLAFVALRVDKSDAADLEVASTRVYFLGGHLLSGVCHRCLPQASVRQVYIVLCCRYTAGPDPCRGRRIRPRQLR